MREELLRPEENVQYFIEISRKGLDLEKGSSYQIVATFPKKKEGYPLIASIGNGVVLD